MLSIYSLWHWQMQLQIQVNFKRCHSDLQITLTTFEIQCQAKCLYFVWFGIIPDTWLGHTCLPSLASLCFKQWPIYTYFDRSLQNPATLYQISIHHQNREQARSTVASFQLTKKLLLPFWCSSCYTPSPCSGEIQVLNSDRGPIF